MLQKYEGAIRTLSPGAERAVFAGLHMPYYPGALYEVLEAAGYWQSDVVVALLRENTEETLREAERLLGKPIARPPAGMRSLPERTTLQAGVDHVLRLIGYVDSSDMRRFTWVARNPQLPTTDSFQRFRLLRVGMTVGQFVLRGGHRRDVSEWVELGRVKLGGAS